MADAIEREAWDELEGELGDLLLQVVYHAQMAQEAGYFDFHAVARRIGEKMIARHPHVFGTQSRDKSAAQQTADWERIKAAERASASVGPAPARTLDGVARGLPALVRAVKLQNRAARIGFDWPGVAPVDDKLQEELAELAQAREAGDEQHVFEEFGDVLFVMANLARHLNIDPEAALRAANDKFIRRFNAVEDSLLAMGKAPEQASLEEMDKLWDAAKEAERRGGEKQD